MSYPAMACSNDNLGRAAGNIPGSANVRKIRTGRKVVTASRETGTTTRNKIF